MARLEQMFVDHMWFYACPWDHLSIILISPRLLKNLNTWTIQWGTFGCVSGSLKLTQKMGYNNNAWALWSKL
jgi:hypothetical protein